METPRKVGKYEIISHIADGGFGVIYKGWDPFIKRPVAIKMCATADEEVRRRFHREAQFIGNLVHRNITLVFDFGVEGGVPYIVQEFLSGFDLDELVRAGVLGASADLKVVVSILLQVCEGLDFAHHRGIVHRDIKPSNIRVLEDGTVKILDFGIAKSLEEGSKLTQTGIALGTAGYLAPEQIQGETIDPRTDIFAVGVVAYELITGIRPFQGPSLSNVLLRILNDQPPPPASVSDNCSPELEAIICRCLEKEPVKRLQTVKDVSAALRQIAMVETEDVDPSNDPTTAILRGIMMKMDRDRIGTPQQPPTKDFPIEPPPETPVDTELRYAPEQIEADDERRRSPMLLTFLALLLVLVAGSAAIYLSEPLQRRIFGAQGAPWVPTPTPTATVTPTPTATPTPAPTPTPTPEPSPTPTPGPIRVRLVVDPPAEVTIDGSPFRSGRILGGVVDLTHGTHTFTLSIPGYPEQVLRRTVTDSTSTLTLLVEVGQITILVDETRAPPGGVAFFDGERLGTVPLVRRKVAAGEHELVVRWEGQPPFRERITVPRLPNPALVLTVGPPSR